METRLEHVRGDTFLKTVTIKDDAGVAINIAGSSFAFTIKNDPDDVVSIASAAGTITDAANGEFTINVPHTTMDFDVGMYYYDIQWTDSSGTIMTIARGPFSLVYDVTN